MVQSNLYNSRMQGAKKSIDHVDKVSNRVKQNRGSLETGDQRDFLDFRRNLSLTISNYRDFTVHDDNYKISKLSINRPKSNKQCINIKKVRYLVELEITKYAF